MKADIKAVIFDADGMVIKGERPSKRLERDFGVPVADINKFFDNEFRRCIVGNADLKDVILPYLTLWKWKGTVDDLLHFWFAESYFVDQDMIDLISHLKEPGVKCALATSQEKYRTEYMKKEMGLGKIFDAIISTCEVGHSKVSKEFISKMESILYPIKPSETVFADDREGNVEIWKGAGFKGHLYTDINSFRQAVGIK